MKVSDLFKKLTVIAKFNEPDDHLNAHAQRTGGGSRKKQLDSIVSVNTVHANSETKTCPRQCDVDESCLSNQSTNFVTVVISQNFKANLN